MAGDLNQLSIIGRLGRDPEVRNAGSSGRIVSFSAATSERWTRDGERQERTTWHRVVIFNEKLGEIAEKYLRKGSRVFAQGSLQSRKYTDKDGVEREIYELVIGRFDGMLQLLDGREAGEGGGRGAGGGGAGSRPASQPKGGAEIDDDIPF